MSTHSSALALSNLLSDLFSVQELEHFLLNFPDDLRNSCPSSGSAQAFFDAAAMAILRRGMADASFYKSLERERPQRSADILRIQRALGFAESSAVIPQIGFHFRGRLQELTVEMLTDFVELLRARSGDDTVVVMDIRSGSIKALLRAKSATCAKLYSLDDSSFLELSRQINRVVRLELFQIREDSWFFDQCTPSPWLQEQVLEDWLRNYFGSGELARFLKSGPRGEFMLQVYNSAPRNVAISRVVSELAKFSLVEVTLIRIMYSRPRMRRKLAMELDRLGVLKDLE